MSEKAIAKVKMPYPHLRAHAHGLNLLDVSGEAEETLSQSAEAKVIVEEEGEEPLSQSAEAKVTEEEEEEEEEPQSRKFEAKGILEEVGVTHLKFRHRCYRPRKSSDMPDGDRPWQISGKKWRHQE